MPAIVIDRVSNGARELSRALDVYRVAPERVSRLRHRTLINWGVSAAFPTRADQRVLNPPAAVRNAVDKVRAFQLFPNGSPPFWTNINAVQRGRDTIILCRRNFLSEGRGITVVRAGEQLVPADFYTKYIRKQAEYRAHVVNGEVICFQQKRRRNGSAPSDNQNLIRNHDNGWVFAVNDINMTDDLRARLTERAVGAVRALGLDFAAVDLIVAKGDASVYFLEANTRPGIESPTVLDAYRRAFSSLQ